VALLCAGLSGLDARRSTTTPRQACALRIARLGLGRFDHERTMPMMSLFQILMLLLDVLWFFIIAHVIMSWLINFQVLNLHQQFVAQIWYGLNRILEPIYAPIRRILPPMSGIDLAPLVALIAVYALRIILMNNMQAFY
jgi:YggT family protein